MWPSSSAATSIRRGSVTSNGGKNEEEMSPEELQTRYVQLGDALASLQKEETTVRSLTANHRSRQEGLLRNRRGLERKVTGADKNMVMLVNRMNQLEERTAREQASLVALEDQQRDLQSKLDMVVQQQQDMLTSVDNITAEMEKTNGYLTAQTQEKRQLTARAREIKESYEIVKEQLVVERNQKDSCQAQRDGILRTMEMISLELKNPNTKETKALTRQKQQLEKQRAQIEQELVTRTQSTSTLARRTKDMEREHAQILGLLPTLDRASSDVQLQADHLAQNESALKRQYRKLKGSAGALSAQLAELRAQAQQLRNSIQGMETVRGGLHAELSKSKELKETHVARFIDVQHGEEALSSRIKQDEFYLDALQKKQTKISVLRAKIQRLLHRQSDPLNGSSSHASPSSFSSSSPPPATARRSSSKAVSVVIHCYNHNIMLTGTITVTSFLVIFEASDKDPTHRFCVDMQDVVSCRLAKDDLVRKVHSSVSLDTEQSVIEIIFRSGYRNRFLFHEHVHNVFGEQIFFGGSHEAISSLCTAMQQAILFHETNDDRNRVRRNSTSTSGRIRSLSDPTQEQKLLLPEQQKQQQKEQKEETRVEKEEEEKEEEEEEEEEPRQDDPHYKFLVDTNGVESSILSEQEMQQVLHAVPSKYQLELWQRLYCITSDGCSLNTFYLRAAASPCSIVLFEDSKGHKFGGFASKPWHVDVHCQYYGSGQAFVFDFQQSGGFRAYKWTGRNDCFQTSDNKYLAMGGGDHYAFRIDSNLEKGISGPCSTFQSPQLSHDEDFVCHKLELWAPCLES